MKFREEAADRQRANGEAEVLAFECLVARLKERDLEAFPFQKPAEGQAVVLSAAEMRLAGAPVEKAIRQNRNTDSFFRHCRVITARCVAHRSAHRGRGLLPVAT